MMKPNFDDILDFVRRGEKDPKLRKTLDLHPDGEELVKQARFMLKALRLLDASWPSASEMMAHEVERGRLEAPAEFLGETLSGGLRHMLFDVAPPAPVPTLAMTVSEDRVTLDSIVSVEDQAAPDELRLAVGRFRLATVREFQLGDPLDIAVSYERDDRPVADVNLIYMPEEGLFTRERTNAQGRANLPVPTHSGTLRVDAPRPAHLAVKVSYAPNS